MPIIPEIKATTGLYTSVGIINSILNDPANTELAGIPNVKNTTESIRMVGQEITAYAPRQNQFINALINRIGMVRIHYMMFTNPWAWAKQGKLEMGETVEQIWMGLAQAFPYDPVAAETNFVKQAPPDVKTAFHSVNYDMVYKITVNEHYLQRAFLSFEGMRTFIEDLIGKVVQSANVDEFMVMKYLLAVLLLAGKIKTQTIPAISKTTASDAITDVTAVTNLFQFPSTEYNIAGVMNTTPLDRLYVLESASANSYIKVNALASAFNIEEVKFMGRVVMFDSLGTYDWTRMDMLFSKDRGYQRFTTAEITALNSVQLIAMDRLFFQIYDNQEYMGTPFINGEGAYTNYPYHVSKIMSASPFHNCVAFTTMTPAVSSVTVNPTTATVGKGGSVAFQATVTTTGFGSSEVIWEISSTVTDSEITQDGVLRVGANETATSITVVVTSVANEAKTATATVTVGTPSAG